MNEKCEKIILEAEQFGVKQDGDIEIYMGFKEIEERLIYFKIYKDKIKNSFYDYCEYQFFKAAAVGKVSEMKTISCVETLHKIVTLKPIIYKIIGFRKCGEPKLVKPKELKGIKAESVDYIPKRCKCQYFLKDNNLYINHHDYFSPSYERPEDIGTPLEYRIQKYGLSSKKKSGFVYADCWGDIVQQQEAWICFENIVGYLEFYGVGELEKICCGKIKKYHGFRDDLDFYWHNMFEQIFRQAKGK